MGFIYILFKKYKRGVVRQLLSPKSCKLSDVKWTSSKLGELGTFIKGAPLSKADIAAKGTPFILYGELYTTYNEVVKNVVRQTEEKVDEIHYSRIGDVVIPTSGETPEEISTASCIMVPNVILAGDLYIFRSAKIDGRIISYILNHIVNTDISRIAQGKSVVHIQVSEISKITLYYPDTEAQKKMIAFFDSLNTKIIQLEGQLDQLRKMKCSFMQRLFI